MQVIRLETKIAAPIERCFLLSLSIDLHRESASSTSERAIAGVTRGIIGPNETVTWRGRHFGFWLTHKTRITGYRRPDWFQDSMEEGAFKSFVHDHYFVTHQGGTLMRDEVRFAAPFGPIGWLLDKAVLRAHLGRFIRERNRVMKQIAESPDGRWREFL